MGNIILKKHNVNFLWYILNKTERGFDLHKLLMERNYGKGFTEKVTKWAKNLDENTSVLVMNEDGHDYLKLDDICNLGCPYSVECSKNSLRTHERMLRKNPIYYFLMQFTTLIAKTNRNNYRKIIGTRNLKEGKTYKLKDLIK